MLIILGGLPGTGKTTLARELAKRTGATHLRIDTIETIVQSLHLKGPEVETAGYRVAYAVARDNLLLGHTVIADSVNSIPITREDWRHTAQSVGSTFVEIEVICSDSSTHKNRIEGRISDITGLKQPSWEAVQQREYHPWDSCNFTIDTSKFTINDCVSAIELYVLQAT